MHRANPAVLYLTIGLASRIAERMGLHRDGDALGLSVCQSEINRRIWWQIQMLEVTVTKLTGNVSMTIYGSWDAKIPSNLNDSDFHHGLKSLPATRTGLTSMSHCLWRFNILQVQRETQDAAKFTQGLGWLLSYDVPLQEKDAKLDMMEQIFRRKYLQYCEPLNPLHVYIQLGIYQLLLAARRSARQPALLNAKISTMSQHERDEFLQLSVKSCEYYIMSQTTESIKGYRWNNENFFQHVACK